MSAADCPRCGGRGDEAGLSVCDSPIRHAEWDAANDQPPCGWRCPGDCGWDPAEPNDPCAPATDPLTDERADILARFTAELAKATGDGSKKRRAGTKPPWYADDSHEAAVFSHLMKWKRGDVIDPDSGAHTLVHLAWRALAIACRESGNTP